VAKVAALASAVAVTSASLAARRRGVGGGGGKAALKRRPRVACGQAAPGSFARNLVVEPLVSQPRSARTSGAATAIAPAQQPQGLVEVVAAEGGRGLGLRMRGEAAKGAVLLEEQPLFVRAPGDRASDSVAAFSELPPARREGILALLGHSSASAQEVGFSGDDLSFLRVLRTNGVALPGGGTAVYGMACRANHSCQPNAALRVAADSSIQVIALRDVAPGEDVLVSYLGEGDLLKPTEHRRRLTSRTWGFSCDCVRCRRPDDTRGFLCPGCGSGHVHALPAAEGEDNGEEGPASYGEWSRCTACGAVPTEEAAQSLRAAEEEWTNHLHALQGPMADLAAMAMYDGLASSILAHPSSAPSPDAHWVAAKLAGRAAETLLARGDAPAALLAADLRRHFARRALGPVASRVEAEALGVDARAAEMAGDFARAARLYRKGLGEARLLPAVGAEGVTKDLSERLQALPQQQHEEEEAGRPEAEAARTARTAKPTVLASVGALPGTPPPLLTTTTAAAATRRSNAVAAASTAL